MNKYIITFGSSQLPEWEGLVNPMKVILVLEDNSDQEARLQLTNTPIGLNFCTSYPYDRSAQEFKDKYNMQEYTLRELMDMLPKIETEVLAEPVMNIKFRAYIPDAEWKDEDMFYQNDQYLSSFLARIYTAYGVNHPSHLKFDIEERMTQYTGLKDKNGVEIFEGDIVKIKYYDDYAENEEGGYIAEIKSITKGCLIEVKNCDYEYTSLYFIFDCMDNVELEIIGNIYENLELLV